MKLNGLSRRDFLKFSSMALATGPMRPLLAEPPGRIFRPSDAVGTVRVAVSEVKIYDEPSYQSNEVRTLGRDELIFVYDKLVSPLGPDFNPYWYRLDDGYVHTAYLQPVETVINDAVYGLKEGGQVGEITVPVTQSMRYTKTYGWQPVYRLYYQSLHWITNIGFGPNKIPWYEITDDLLKVTYNVPAKHVRLVPESEMTPIGAEVPLEDKWIFINIKHQSLTAFEGGEVVLHTEVSTGIPGLVSTNEIDTATPRGAFNVGNKMPVRHMGDGALTDDIEAYELPGVPWVSYFVETGVAFHGTYWHDNYGNEMSHGCVNMRPEEAKWLWRWTQPVIEPNAWLKQGFGTQVFVE